MEVLVCTYTAINVFFDLGEVGYSMRKSSKYFFTCVKNGPRGTCLSSTSKLFEYEKLSREIDKSGDMEQLKTMLRCYIKLYLKQQETISVIA